jgi:S-adenosylmethionine synthetase
MPLPITLAHRLARHLDAARTTGASFLAPDGKTQVAVEYRDGRPVRLRDITVTTALADETVAPHVLAEAVRELVVRPAIAGISLADGRAPAVHVNPGGTHLVGGPARHAGLTGRKNGIDTYGEIARQSGAALSGKDPSRIDRSGAYAARHAAKQVVAAGLAERCEVHLAYSIGVARPVSLSVNTFGTGSVADDAVAAALERALDFRPGAIVRRLDLRKAPRRAGVAGFYRRLAVYGHFGRPELDLPWEKTEAVDAVRG